MLTAQESDCAEFWTISKLPHSSRSANSSARQRTHRGFFGRIVRQRLCYTLSRLVNQLKAFFGSLLFSHRNGRYIGIATTIAAGDCSYRPEDAFHLTKVQKPCDADKY